MQRGQFRLPSLDCCFVGVDQAYNGFGAADVSGQVDRHRVRTLVPLVVDQSDQSTICHPVGDHLGRGDWLCTNLVRVALLT